MSTPLQRAAAIGVEDYDPGPVVEAVNELQPLGREGALREIEAQLAGPANGTDNLGLFWVLRVLFEAPEFAPVRLGQPDIPPPADPAALPRFPIVLARDVPLLVVGGYDLAGLAEPVQAHVDFYRERGEVRARPLAPPEGMDGVEDDFARQWTAAYGERHAEVVLARVRSQIARMPLG
jgi:hypothetical protein